MQVVSISGSPSIRSRSGWLLQLALTRLESVVRQSETIAVRELPATALLADVLRKTDQTLTVDLRSGGTGPNQLLQHQFKQDHGLAVKVMLTDKFPNIPAFETIHKKTRG